MFTVVDLSLTESVFSLTYSSVDPSILVLSTSVNRLLQSSVERERKRQRARERETNRNVKRDTLSQSPSERGLLRFTEGLRGRTE